MSADDLHNRKFKGPKQKTPSTSTPTISKSNNNTEVPLAAKDSEWTDILQVPVPGHPSTSPFDEEEDGPETKPLAIMFPGLLDKDPQTLQGVLSRAMSTTEVTKHLVNLGQKANFTFMKKAIRLIPKDKQWLECLKESTDSNDSVRSYHSSQNSNT